MYKVNFNFISEICKVRGKRLDGDYICESLYNCDKGNIVGKCMESRCPLINKKDNSNN